MLPWTFDDAGQSYTAFRVNQWSVDPDAEDFEPLQTVLDPSGAPVESTRARRAAVRMAGAPRREYARLVRRMGIRRPREDYGPPVGSPGYVQFSSRCSI